MKKGKKRIGIWKINHELYWFSNPLGKDIPGILRLRCSACPFFFYSEELIDSWIWNSRHRICQLGIESFLITSSLLISDSEVMSRLFFLRVFGWLSGDRLRETISIHTGEVLSRAKLYWAEVILSLLEEQERKRHPFRCLLPLHLEDLTLMVTIDLEVT